MTDLTRPTPLSRRATAFFRALAALSVAHALLVLLLWLQETYSKVSMVSGMAWLVLAWLWLVWPIVLALHPAGSRRRIAIPVVIGLILLAPCAGTVFLFTIWALEDVVRTG